VLTISGVLVEEERLTSCILELLQVDLDRTTSAGSNYAFSDGR
jgi:hypothetical protein